MDWLLEIYLAHKNWIDLIKDLVFFAGAYTFFHGVYVLFKILKNKRFSDTASAIEKNLHFREKLEPVLNEFIFETAKNTKDVAIRFVHWKNYPWKLGRDGYKHYPWIRYFDDNTVHYGWMDNTGLNIQNPIWYLGYSVYIDTNGIFFTEREGQTFKGFEEFADTTLVFHLPYTNIVNYDFREVIEYEPVFYLKHPYHERKKLYDDHVIVRKRDGHGYLNIELSQKHMMRKYTWPRYWWLKVYLSALSFLRRNKNAANQTPH